MNNEWRAEEQSPGRGEAERRPGILDMKYTSSTRLVTESAPSISGDNRDGG